MLVCLIALLLPPLHTTRTTQCIAGSDTSTGKHAVAYMRALAASAAGTFLPECPEEQSFVGGACADMCQEMAQEIALRVAELLRALVVEALHIEMKATPVEAFHRLVLCTVYSIHTL
jgi:hypothetical protein